MQSPLWLCFTLGLCFILSAVFYSSSVTAQNKNLNSVNHESISPLSMKGILGSPASGQKGAFKQVLQPREFHFPQDHLAHQAYKTEWWYLTGNLSTDNLKEQDIARNFSYQFTLFRFALSANKAPKKDSASAWRSNNIYMAHIALTDIDQQQFYQRERFSRDGLDLAGVEQKDDGSLHFWLNDWQLKSLTADRLFPLKLHIRDKDFVLNLQLQAVKPMVLQGDKGLSQKSNQHASYYYSYTRLKSRGDVTIGDRTYQLSGNSWFDREWSTSSLGDDQQGWDWFALHLNDGSDLMLYQMRKKDGTKDSFSSGIVVDPQGKGKILRAREFQIKAIKFWQSPVSHIQYPISWQILIPEKNIKLIVSAQVKAQEWSKAAGFSFNYWEGSVTVDGTKDQQTVTGSGYLEMTGYD